MWSTRCSTQVPDQRRSATEAEPSGRARDSLANWRPDWRLVVVGAAVVVATVRIFLPRLRKPKAAGTAGLAGTAVATDAPPHRRDGLRHLSLIKRGAKYIVFSADCPQLDTRIVCKEALPTANPETLEREYKALIDLQGVHHVLKVIDFDNGMRAPPNDSEPQRLYVEFLPGQNLQNAMDGWNKTPSDPTKDEVIKIAKQVAKTMSVVHETGYAHRDLKPENLMRLPNGDITIIDFGFAAKIDNEVAMAEKLGTAAFLAPEIGIKFLDDTKEKDPYDEKVDVFAFSMTLWELITRESAFAGMEFEDAVRAIAQGYRGSLIWNPPCRCGPELAALIDKCWAANPDSRPSFSTIVDHLNMIERLE